VIATHPGANLELGQTVLLEHVNFIHNRIPDQQARLISPTRCIPPDLCRRGREEDSTGTLGTPLTRDTRPLAPLLPSSTLPSTSHSIHPIPTYQTRVSRPRVTDSKVDLPYRSCRGPRKHYGFISTPPQITPQGGQPGGNLLYSLNSLNPYDSFSSCQSYPTVILHLNIYKPGDNRECQCSLVLHSNPQHHR
jgi:hypothetical protein